MVKRTKRKARAHRELIDAAAATAAAAAVLQNRNGDIGVGPVHRLQAPGDGHVTNATNAYPSLFSHFPVEYNGVLPPVPPRGLRHGVNQDPPDAPPLYTATAEQLPYHFNH